MPIFIKKVYVNIIIRNKHCRFFVFMKCTLSGILINLPCYHGPMKKKFCNFCRFPYWQQVHKKSLWNCMIWKAQVKTGFGETVWLSLLWIFVSFESFTFCFGKKNVRNKKQEKCWKNCFYTTAAWFGKPQLAGACFQCQGRAPSDSNGEKMTVNYQRKWRHKNMDFSHIK